jgi:nucleoside 2-deoxyribosyltransferase
LGGNVTLVGYVDHKAKSAIGARLYYINPNTQFQLHDVNDVAGFHYTHGLETPTIHQPKPYAPISMRASKVVAFGMLVGDAIIDSEWAVYDPQNVHDPLSFSSNGSKAKHLALVLNRHEAKAMLGGPGRTVEEMATALAEREAAEVVIIKQGPMGALVYDKGVFSRVPAYRTTSVWKIGSGDQFVANFAYAWLEEGRTAAEAADRASRATALYCQTGSFPTKEEIDNATLQPIAVGRYAEGFRATVYLAGPFFTLGQLWVVEQAKTALESMGFKVFSPYHDVGHGSADDVVHLDLKHLDQCDLVFAIGDGMDAGTVFEVGYARARAKPVIFYAENECGEDRKMIEGSDCLMTSDFVSAIYLTVWEAVGL